MAAADRLIFRNESVTFNIDILEIFKKKIYDGFDTAHKVEPQMWREITRILNEATIEGISQSRLATTLEGSAPVLEGSPSSIPTHDEAFYQALRHSNEVFAAFKVHTFGKDMAAKLFDSDGKLKSFDQWTQDTMGITSHQVGSWLETEYNTAILRAHQAADWQEFVRNKDIFPNLRWLMTTSPDPEDTHKHYWMTGLTLPVDDPFWNKHYPGDHWNCKCSLESTDAPVHRPADIPEEKPAPGLDENPGKEGHIFTQSHPYFPKGCSSCFANKANGVTNAFLRLFENNAKRCFECHKIEKNIQKALDLGGITGELAKLRIAKGAEYGKVLRGIVNMKDFKPLEGEKDVFYTGGESSKDFEPLKNAARKAVANGYKVYLLPNPGIIRSADVILERHGHLAEYDVKTISGKNSAGSRLMESIGQTNRVILNLATDYNPRNLSVDIKKYFESNPDAVEVLVFKRNKVISVTRKIINNEFTKNFMNRFRE